MEWLPTPIFGQMLNNKQVFISSVILISRRRIIWTHNPSVRRTTSLRLPTGPDQQDSVRGGNPHGPDPDGDAADKAARNEQDPDQGALIALETEGLLFRTGRSFSVLFLSAEEIKEMYQVRVILEAEAARLFAKNATEDNLRALAAVLDELRKLNESKNPEPYVLADVSSRFHSTIAAGSGNRYVEKYANDIRLKLRVVRVSLFTSLDRMNDELKEHTEIFQSLKERDSEGAWKKMYEHETKTMQYVIEKVIPRLV